MTDFNQVQLPTKQTNSNYRTRAIISRSRLVAAPLRNHAKKHFLCVFYALISSRKNSFLTNRRG